MLGNRTLFCSCSWLFAILVSLVTGALYDLLSCLRKVCLVLIWRAAARLETVVSRDVVTELVVCCLILTVFRVMVGSTLLALTMLCMILSTFRCANLVSVRKAVLVILLLSPPTWARMPLWNLISRRLGWWRTSRVWWCRSDELIMAFVGRLVTDV